MQDFRQLNVWARAHAFAIVIRRLTRGFRGASADFRDQLVTAAESIPSNIVEGCGAATNREFARYLDISIKSAFEVDYRLELAKEYKLISPDEWLPLATEAVEIRKMLYGLRRAVLARDSSPPKHKRSRTDKPRKRDSNPDADPDT
jgi:four helix bundle protein